MANEPCREKGVDRKCIEAHLGDLAAGCVIAAGQRQNAIVTPLPPIFR
jgi:hypothetical protein